MARYSFIRDEIQMDLYGKPEPEYMSGKDILNAYFSHDNDAIPRVCNDRADAENTFQEAKKECCTWISSGMIGRILRADVLILEEELDDGSVDILDAYAADLINPSQEQRDFIEGLIENLSHYDEPKEMTAEDAAYDLRQLAYESSYDVPDGLTPELYAAIWNEQVRENPYWK